MASREQLKTFFKNEAKPSESEFEELIESMKHVDDDDSNNDVIFAEISEARQGVELTKVMSPFLTHDAIEFNVRLSKLPDLKSDIDDELIPIALEIGQHRQNTNNPHGVTKTQIGLDQLPNLKSDSTNYNNGNSLATSKAVYDLKGYVDGTFKNTSQRYSFINDFIFPLLGALEINNYTSPNAQNGVLTVEGDIAFVFNGFVPDSVTYLFLKGAVVNSRGGDADAILFNGATNTPTLQISNIGIGMQVGDTITVEIIGRCDVTVNNEIRTFYRTEIFTLTKT